MNNIQKKNQKVWILTGNEENWETAIKDNIWGVREGRLNLRDI